MRKQNIWRYFRRVFFQLILDDTQSCINADPTRSWKVQIRPDPGLNNLIRPDFTGYRYRIHRVIPESGRSPNQKSDPRAKRVTSGFFRIRVGLIVSSHVSEILDRPWKIVSDCFCSSKVPENGALGADTSSLFVFVDVEEFIISIL
jgi:hypothetical protein